MYGEKFNGDPGVKKAVSLEFQLSLCLDRPEARRLRWRVMSLKGAITSDYKSC
jgi:hypothetical protein